MLKMTIVIMILTVSYPEKTMAFNWESHREITRRGLIGLDITAMREIVDGNLSVDQGKLEKQRAPHFDSESLSGGAAFIRDRLETASDALGVCDFQRARKMFGQALHTTQDFYSHSNWVEKNLSNPSASIDVTLVQDNGPAVRSSWIPSRCCQDMGRRDCQNLPLTTGFMVSDNLLWRKCTHNQMNKDSDKKKYFSQAVERAVEATRQIFKDFITNLVEQNGTERAQELIVAFVKGHDKTSSRLCSQKTVNVTCREQKADVLPHHVSDTVEQIYESLLDDELPADLYN